MSNVQILFWFSALYKARTDSESLQLFLSFYPPLTLHQSFALTVRLSNGTNVRYQLGTSEYPAHCEVI